MFKIKKMMRSFVKSTSKDVGIDLGTANTVVYVRNEGILIDEPTYIAINLRTESIENIGIKAKEVIGRTASHTKIIRPLKNGVISNYEITEKMLERFLNKIKKDKFQSARVIICVPSGVTQVERRAVMDVVKDSGAKEVYLVEEPVAAAIGAGIDIFEPRGHMIIDIGGGTTELAFIVSGGVAYSTSIKVAGDRFNEDIIDFIRQKYNLLIGETTAEKLKIDVSNSSSEKELFEIRGRELVTGLPKSMKVHGHDIDEAITRDIDTIIETVKLALEGIEPEVSADIYETGIFLSGGGAAIKELTRKLEKEFNLTVTIAEEPIYAVIKGIAIILENFAMYKNVIISSHAEY